MWTHNLWQPKENLNQLHFWGQWSSSWWCTKKYDNIGCTMGIWCFCLRLEKDRKSFNTSNLAYLRLLLLWSSETKCQIPVPVQVMFNYLNILINLKQRFWRNVTFTPMVESCHMVMEYRSFFHEPKAYLQEMKVGEIKLILDNEVNYYKFHVP